MDKQEHPESIQAPPQVKCAIAKIDNVQKEFPTWGKMPQMARVPQMARKVPQMARKALQIAKEPQMAKVPQVA